MSTAEPSRRPAIALLPWGDWFHDCLDELGVTVDDLISEFTGSWIFGYAAALDSAGVQTVLIAPTSAVTRPVRRIHVPTGATIWLLPVSRAFRALRDWGYRKPERRRRDLRLQLHVAAADVAPYLGTPLRALARVLRAEHCRAILCQEYETPRFDLAVPIARLLGLPLVASFQSGDVHYSGLERHIRPHTISRAERLVIGAGEEITRVRASYGISDERIARIPNPIDTTFWRRETDGGDAAVALGLPKGPIVAWHGRFNAATKGLDVLLAAWEHMATTGREQMPHLVLAGSGRDVGLVRDIVAARRLGRVTVLDGWHRPETIRFLLCAATIYAFPSRREGFPLAPIEAMACGCPVVGSDAKGVPEVIGPTGVVVAREDFRGLADAITTLLADEPKRRDLSAAAVRRAREQFSLEVVGAQLRDLLLSEQRLEQASA